MSYNIIKSIYPVRCARQAATVPNLRLEIEDQKFFGIWGVLLESMFAHLGPLLSLLLYILLDIANTAAGNCRKLLEKSIELGAKFDEKSLKIEAPGALWRTSATLLAPSWPRCDWERI